MKGFEFRVIAHAGRQHAAILKRFIPRVHGMLKSPVRDLSIALVGDVRMSTLHEQFLAIAGPTDVLTFPLDVDSRGRTISGEVVICVPEASRQAQLRGIPIANEVLLYAIHGLLHLSGFDDKTAPAFRKMHAMEDKILTRLGLGAIFSVEPTPRRRRRGSAPAVFKAADRKLGA